jgi:hypothetical protein
MRVESWIQEMRNLLDELQQIDLGYPLGVTIIETPQPADVVRRELSRVGLEQVTSIVEFYSSCDGVSLRNVHNGYSIHSVTRLQTLGPQSEPDEITGPFADKVVMLGSSGGGDLFVFRRTYSDVLLLPPGPLHAGVYDGSLYVGTPAEVKLVGRNFEDFLEVLLADVRAFVKNTPGYRFMA